MIAIIDVKREPLVRCLPSSIFPRLTNPWLQPLGADNRKDDFVKIERIWAMPNKNTFDIKPIKNLIQEELDKDELWIDPFANKNKFAKITNDLNPE